MYLTKVGVLNWYSPTKIFFRKIQTIFDVEKWLWKSEICNFVTLSPLSEKVQKKGMGNLKYLKPSDEGILQFLSNSIEIWSRDQFFHENQLCFRSGVIFWWNKGCKRGKFLFFEWFHRRFVPSNGCHSFNFWAWILKFWQLKVLKSYQNHSFMWFFICLVKNRCRWGKWGRWGRHLL